MKTTRPANAQEAAPETLPPHITHTALAKTPLTDGTDDLQARIARKAYELAEMRGFAPGAEMADWLFAERVLLSATVQTPPEEQFTG